MPKRISKKRAVELKALYHNHTINGEYEGLIFSLEPFNQYEQALEYITEKTALLEPEEKKLGFTILELYEIARDRYYASLGKWGAEYVQLLKQEASDAAKAKREQQELNDLLS